MLDILDGFFPTKIGWFWLEEEVTEVLRFHFFDIPMVMGVCVTNRMMWMICAMDSHGW